MAKETDKRGGKKSDRRIFAGVEYQPLKMGQVVAVGKNMRPKIFPYSSGVGKDRDTTATHHSVANGLTVIM